ncbi:NAD-dependent epimerase/dehydratase family protein [Halalkalibacterium ligniniphilum]|uniref:NAD-dependent epimerase/dehydratase family protein n=2 Tax=Halalkalibacterium ligniniphilum TaxID=1134413 RepID=UPI00034A4029|nr:NAD(P)-dependent oxidoreductase [Halalkalibacterium ligniniphilum]
MQKAVITGALGFIGFHLCEHLVQEGVEVIAIDDTRGPHTQEVYEEKQLRIGRNALFTFVNQRVEDCNLTKLLKGADVIFHLAAATKSDSKWPYLPEVIKTNVHVTKTLLHACVPPARFIYASTVEVYGDRVGLITERTPTNPSSSYGVTKLASEEIVKNEARKKGLDYIILRLPTVYGPWQRDDMTYQQILVGKEQMTEDRSTLDVLYIDDVIEGLLLAAKTKAVGEVFHLTTGKENLWYKGKSYLLNNKTLTKPLHKVSLCPKKAKTQLGFEAKMSLSEGLEKQREHVTKWQERKDLL